MNAIIVTGKIDSETKVINTNNGTPLCRFTLLVDNRKFNCIVAGKKAFKFLYEVKLGAGITIDSVINDRNQLVVQRYEIISPPNNFGYVFDYKGRRMPHKKRHVLGIKRNKLEVIFLKLLSRTRNDYDVNVPALLDSKGISGYYLYSDKYIKHGRAFECWWYEHKEKNHFLMKHLHSSHQLFFIGLEENEVFIIEGFDYYLEHGEFKDDWSFDEMIEIDKTNKSKC